MEKGKCVENPLKMTISQGVHAYLVMYILFKIQQLCLSVSFFNKKVNFPHNVVISIILNSVKTLCESMCVCVRINVPTQVHFNVGKPKGLQLNFRCFIMLNIF